MDRIPIVAGNWKMNLTGPEVHELLETMLNAGIDELDGVEKVVFPPFPYLVAAWSAIKSRDSVVGIGAQNMHWENKGAFTGEVSPLQVRDFAEYVLIGHSERRAYFGETDETVNKKLEAALVHGLYPIVCVGETGAQRQAGETEAVLSRQVRGALARIDLTPDCIIAYEPVWAIGTGVAATVQDANDAIAFIRGQVRELQGDDIASQIRILYGGSVTPANIAELVAQPEIDGGLVGGASLIAESFVEMVRSVAALTAEPSN